ncbi:MAG TPA: carboxypeptidase regulatory-like domain-containing protein [Thermoanaerobaculia bacterium]|nr:carboxypeptidase regulatory-like domain-containing protein [Thermoanaerobaculia bacterium]
MRKFFMAVLLSGFATSALAIGEARMTGKVIDAEGNPIPDVTITAEAIAGKTIKETLKTNKEGRFTLFVLDGTLRYRLTYEKEGFAIHQEEVKMRLLPNRNDVEIRLLSAQAAQELAVGRGEADPAILLYNEGVDLANQKMIPEAIAKMEEAVALKNDFTAAHMALAKLYSRSENWPKAISCANAALEIAIEDDAMFSILAQAYEKTGDQAKAKEFKMKAPADPVSLFNEAARLINDGKDTDAQPLLARAIGADDKFAPAHYEMGMIYVRSGDNPNAKKHLQRYLAIEPNGKDAELAKEMLKYVQ